jgi:hypothetical protein
MAYADNIEHQLRMLDATWEAFKEHGVTKDTELVLEFMYLAPNKDSANALDAALGNYDTYVRSEGMLKKKWFVNGKSYPTTVSKEKLAQWLEFMIALGWEHGCKFDGFGATMPDNR